jgi:hypothetical protein
MLQVVSYRPGDLHSHCYRWLQVLESQTGFHDKDYLQPNQGLYFPLGSTRMGRLVMIPSYRRWTFPTASRTSLVYIMSLLELVSRFILLIF